MKVIFLCLLLSACGCGVSTGDKVTHIETGRLGKVVNVDSSGSWTDQCDIAVRFENKELVYWVKAFEFELITDN